MSPPCIVLLGETGHGKSSIVNNLRDPGISAAEVGKRGGGVTRQVAAYAMPSEWNRLVVDTPGFGCIHMPLTRIIADIERLFAEKDVRGIAVTCPVDSPRLMLGTQVVQAGAGVRPKTGWLKASLSIMRAFPGLWHDAGESMRHITMSAAMIGQCKRLFVSTAQGHRMPVARCSYQSSVPQDHSYRDPPAVKHE